MQDMVQYLVLADDVVEDSHLEELENIFEKIDESASASSDSSKSKSSEKKSKKQKGKKTGKSAEKKQKKDKSKKAKNKKPKGRGGGSRSNKRNDEPEDVTMKAGSKCSHMNVLVTCMHACLQGPDAAKDPEDVDAKTMTIAKANKVGINCICVCAAGVACQVLQRATAKIKQAKTVESQQPFANMRGACLLMQPMRTMLHAWFD